MVTPDQSLRSESLIQDSTNASVDAPRIVKFPFNSERVRGATLLHLLSDMWKHQFGEGYVPTDEDRRWAVALTTDDLLLPDGTLNPNLPPREIQRLFDCYLHDDTCGGERHSIAGFARQLQWEPGAVDVGSTTVANGGKVVDRDIRGDSEGMGLHK